MCRCRSTRRDASRAAVPRGPRASSGCRSSSVRRGRGASGRWRSIRAQALPGAGSPPASATSTTSSARPRAAAARPSSAASTTSSAVRPERSIPSTARGSSPALTTSAPATPAFATPRATASTSTPSVVATRQITAGTSDGWRGRAARSCRSTVVRAAGRGARPTARPPPSGSRRRGARASARPRRDPAGRPRAAARTLARGTHGRAGLRRSRRLEAAGRKGLTGASGDASSDGGVGPCTAHPSRDGARRATAATPPPSRPRAQRSALSAQRENRTGIRDPRKRSPETAPSTTS